MAIHTIATEGNVGDDHRLVIQLPDEVPAGTHEVIAVVTVREEANCSVEEGSWQFPVLEGTTWPKGAEFNRADLYDAR